MPQSGFTGISYPFRVSNRGGVVVTSTSATDPTHIAESLAQIFKTSFLERPMESEIYSNISRLIFEPNDKALQELIRSEIIDDIERLEERVSVEGGGIDFSVETDDKGIDSLFVTITYKVLRYNTTYTSKIKIGGVPVE